MGRARGDLRDKPEILPVSLPIKLKLRESFTFFSVDWAPEEVDQGPRVADAQRCSRASVAAGQPVVPRVVGNRTVHNFLLRSDPAVLFRLKGGKSKRVTLVG